MSRTIASILVVAVLSQAAFSQSKTKDGAVLGGIGGAVVGGIIGHQNDETPEGILIGSAVGAIAGGILGNVRDKQIQEQRYYQHQAWQSQQAVRHAQQTQVRRCGVSISDIISMSRSGVSEMVIISHVQSNGIQRKLEVSEIIALHQSGVSDNVIATMQNAHINGQTTYVAPVRPQPSSVIVHETYSPAPTVLMPAQVLHHYPTHYRSYHYHRHGF